MCLTVGQESACWQLCMHVEMLEMWAFRVSLVNVNFGHIVYKVDPAPWTATRSI